MNSGWEISSSDEDDDQTLLPASKMGKRFASPSRIQNKQFLKVEQKKDCLNKVQNSSFEKNCSRVKILSYSSKTSHFSNDNNAYVKNDAESPIHKKIIDPVKVWQSAAPNYYFLTNCSGISSTYNYSNISGANSSLASMGIQDILSSKFGSLVQSAQFNFCFDIEWLINQYPENSRNKPLLIVYGERGDSNVQLRAVASRLQNLQLCRVDLPPYGTHHTKMMLLHYSDGIRVVISTANLIAQDWNKKSQGFYMSPLFPILSKPCNTSQSNFKSDLIDYISCYNQNKLKQWIEILQKCDMSVANNVRLVGSVPGRHSGASLTKWGHMRLRSLLREKLNPVDSDWPVIGQFSSIGSLGADKHKWLCSEWLTSLSSSNLGPVLPSTIINPPLKLIFPTVENVRCSFEGYSAGSSLPYSSRNASKQHWLLPLLHQWKADHVGRGRASPHVKSYTRISPDSTNIKAAWFLLTSANLSKAAWGALEKKETQLLIRSYELGVLFFPHSDPHNNVNCRKHIKLDNRYFNVQSSSPAQNNLSFPFSLPLVPYASSDSPWTWDSPHLDKPDHYGNIWNPC